MEIMNMSNLKKIEDRDDIWKALVPYVHSWMPMKFLKQVIWARDNGHITHVELTRGTTSDHWDGNLYLKLADPKDAMFVINNFVMLAAANEVSMTDERTLRLWWD
jgi:hypothetical protein